MKLILMHKKWFLICLTSFLFANSVLATPKTVKVTYIGNEGVLIEP